MSIFNKKWKFYDSAPADFINLFPEFSDITKQLLWNRDIKEKTGVSKFFSSNYSEDLHDPYLLKDIKKAAIRILGAIKKNESILIYGDYDADGVCASTLLKTVLERLGAQSVKVYIPDRHDEGYGMNLEAMEKFVKDRVNLIITVDCGSANIGEIEFAQKNGVDVIVTDHHQVLENSNFAYAFINPQRKDDKYPFKGLSGTTVAFKLTQVLLNEDKKEGGSTNLNLPEGWEKWLLDLVAISIVTDVMPLIDENRILLKFGLLVLAKTRRLGIRALMKQARVNINKIDAHTLGFVLGPRLNAAGRMLHANLAFDLLNSEDFFEAERLAQELEVLNNERRDVVAEIVRDLNKKEFNKDFAIIEGSESWPIGVLGIAAGRLADKYNKPTFLYQKKHSTLVGSARTPELFNTVTILASSSLYLEKFGGHAQAGGFTALLSNEEHLRDLIKKVSQEYAEQIGEDKIVPTVKIDAHINLKDINWDLWDEIERFNPFGEGNLKPMFLAESVCVVSSGMVGQNGNHFRCCVKDTDGNSKKAIGFNFPVTCARIKGGDKLDIVFNIDLDEWNGNRELSLKLIDIKHHG